MALRILQIGAGSMGTRRLRDLAGRPGLTLALFDGREDRRQRAHARFGIEVFAEWEAAQAWAPAAVVISTPPGTKSPYVDWALRTGRHHFVEADIWSYGAAPRAEKAQGLVCAPSLTFGFLPIARALTARVPAEIGPLLGYQFFLAGDMAAWHPAEGREYYGRHRDTAPAREMVPFELAWLQRLWGPARTAQGHYARSSGRSESFEDTWTLQLELARGGTGQMTVTMGCPRDERSGIAFGAHGAARWDINRGRLSLEGAGRPEPDTLDFGPIGAAIEAAYAEEILHFAGAVEGGPAWPHPYSDYQHAIAILAAAEESAQRGVRVPVAPGSEPTRQLLPPPAC